ncbi:toprim domain-containing protein [Variovorax sp. PBL-E5]|uniref:toprim domain-containing protein n=1 Tax=Variovorax sp. PBL-E5 TaxID=434014 RepID=UPI001317B0F2|nr:toprim domain-containing protein [Variovorax sp. PBL-E5]VTU24825.1 DNA primase TraC [Variovorax sp. PBL-E5]
MNAIDQFLTAIESAGLTPPATINDDGKLHRFSPTGKRGDDAGWYVLHLDGVPAGSFGDWRSGEAQNWCAKSDNDMSEAERQGMRERVKAAQRMRDAETTRRHGEAAVAALALWDAAAPAVAHPYLIAKGVKPHGIRADGHQLFVPMRDSAGKLHSLQTIAPDGGKRFLPGGRVRGCYYAIGKPSGRLIVCEGFATGATLHQATGDAVAVAFNAGNLLAVAVALHAKYPCLNIVVAADDDWKTPGNPGLTTAKQAAQAVGGKVAVPDFTDLQRGDKDTDYNDLQRLAGAVQIGGEA